MSTALGQPINRVEGREKVTGEARYSADFNLPGTVHAVIVGATVPAGRVTHIDLPAPEAVPGVVAIFTHESLPGVHGKTMLIPSLAGGPAHGQSFFPMQDDEIHYYGQPVALVVAETLEQAEFAADLVSVQYEQTEPLTTIDEGRDEAYDAARIFGGFMPGHVSRGDLEAGLAEARYRIDASYTFAANHHNPIEPSATTAVWEGDQVTLYESTQGISATQLSVGELLGKAHAKARMVGGLLARGQLTKLLDASEPDVRVIGRYVGGGFGSKAMVWPHSTLAALAARVVDRPVKLVLTREQMFFSCGHREEQEQEVTLGADADGQLVALRHHKLSLTSHFDDWAEPALSAPGKLYRCPNYDARYRLIKGNTMTPTFTRSPGESTGMFVLETAMDELAERVGIDPIELRLRNLSPVDPETDEPWSSCGLPDCLERGAELFGWHDRATTPGSKRDGNWQVGVGMAVAIYPVYKAMHSQRARCSIDTEGRVTVAIGTQEFGTGSATIAVQVAAAALGVDVATVDIEYGDTTLPVSTAQVGSSGAGAIASSVDAAARNLCDLLLKRITDDPASPLHAANTEDVQSENGIFRTAGTEVTDSFADIVRRSGEASLEAEGVWDPPRPKPGKTDYGLTFGAQFVEVGVDADLGLVRVRRMLGVFAPGRVLNAKTARSQLVGGMIWGLGQALLEATHMDANAGRWANSSLGEYLVAINADIPEVQVEFVEVHDKKINPLGVKGVGEIGQVGVAAAIANAIYNATGRRMRSLPITLDKVMN